MFKSKLFYAFLFIALLFLAKWVLWDMEISSGKRVGNLTKLSKVGKIPFLKTWEGTLDEGSGDKLTTEFSIENEELAKELYSYEGKQVILYYTQNVLSFPRETTTKIVSWKPKEAAVVNNPEDQTQAPQLDHSLFCAMLGAIYKNQDLYQKVKEFIKTDNPYLYYQYEKCNKN